MTCRERDVPAEALSDRVAHAGVQTQLVALIAHAADVRGHGRRQAPGRGGDSDDDAIGLFAVPVEGPADPAATQAEISSQIRRLGLFRLDVRVDAGRTDRRDELVAELCR